MGEVIISRSQDKPQSISQEIWSRVKQRFYQQDVAEYKWVFTRYFYGRGHYPDLTTFKNNLSGSATIVPILYHDDETWNLSVFRHRRRLYEFFVPGLNQQKGDGSFIAYSDFYPLTPEEKKRAGGIIQEELEEQFELEVSCLVEYMRNNIGGNFFTQFNPNNLKPREFVVLFGSELYKGENPENFRSKKLEYRPSIEIYVWEHGFRPSQPKKINH